MPETDDAELIREIALRVRTEVHGPGEENERRRGERGSVAKMALFEEPDENLPLLTTFRQVELPDGWDHDPARLVGSELDQWMVHALARTSPWTREKRAALEEKGWLPPFARLFSEEYERSPTSYRTGGLWDLNQLLRSEARAHEVIAHVVDATADGLSPSERDRIAFDSLVENHWSRPRYQWLGAAAGSADKARINCTAVFPPGTAQQIGIQAVLEEFRRAVCRHPALIARCRACRFPFVWSVRSGGSGSEAPAPAYCSRRCLRQVETKGETT